eukprot:symbB.v1.2.036736.t1/scaffold5124.1/size30633/2
MQLLPPDPRRIRTFAPLSGPSLPVVRCETVKAPLRALEGLSDACDWAGLNYEAWDAVADQIGGVADLWHLAQLSADQLRHAIATARLRRDEGGGGCLTATEAAQVGLIWRVARASDAELPDELPEDAEDAEDALPEPHPRAQLKDALWYEVTYNKVFIKKAPSELARSWGWVHLGQKIQVVPRTVMDENQREWVELTFLQLARSCPERLCSDDPLGRGFAMVEGGHLGLGTLLSGPLPPQEWPEGPEDAQCTAEQRVTLRQLSGQRLQIQVAPGDVVGRLVARAQKLLKAQVTLVHDGQLLSMDAPAGELAGQEVDVVLLPPSPRAVAGVNGGEVFPADGYEDGSIKYWELDSFNCLGSLDGHRGSVWALDADLNSKLALSGSADTSLMLWDLERLECLRSFEGHSGAVCCVSANFLRKWAVSGSDDGTLRLWSFNQRSALLTLRCPQGTAWSIAASCEDQAAVSGHEGGSVQVWNFLEGSDAVPQILEGRHQGLVQVVQADFQRQKAASGSDDGIYCIWDISRMVCTYLVQDSNPQAVWSMDPSFDISFAALSGRFDGTLQLWDVREDEPVKSWRGLSVCSLASNFTAKRAVSGTYDGRLQLWNLRDGTCEGGSSTEHGSAVRAIVANFE